MRWVDGGRERLRGGAPVRRGGGRPVTEADRRRIDS